MRTLNAPGLAGERLHHRQRQPRSGTAVPAGADALRLLPVGRNDDPRATLRLKEVPLPLVRGRRTFLARCNGFVQNAWRIQTFPSASVGIDRDVRNCFTPHTLDRETATLGTESTSSLASSATSVLAAGAKNGDSTADYHFLISPHVSMSLPPYGLEIFVDVWTHSLSIFAQYAT